MGKSKSQDHHSFLLFPILENHTSPSRKWGYYRRSTRTWQIRANSDTTCGPSHMDPKCDRTTHSRQINEIHWHVMENTPDIFVLMDTRSDGHTIRSGWDWRRYRIQETHGKLSGHHACRPNWVLIGIHNTLTMAEDYTDVPGILKHRMAQIIIRYSKRGKPVAIKVVGSCAPPLYIQYGRGEAISRENKDFFEQLKPWMKETNHKIDHWIMAGDYNTTLRPIESSQCSYAAMREVATGAYRSILAHSEVGLYDWWEMRDDIVPAQDRTRKGWGEKKGTTGMSIIDRFIGSRTCIVSEMGPRNELFVQERTTLHITEGKFFIQDLDKTIVDEVHLRRWIERRIRSIYSSK
jgi:hypothetical protein